MHDLQERMRDVRLVVCDEMSMVGRRLLRATGRRVRAAKARAGDLFGGIFVWDFAQHPAVFDKLMYARQPGGGL